MGLLDGLKTKADQNGDGKLDIADLTELKDNIPTEQFEQLKAKADQNGDGKLDFEDVKNLDFGGIVDSAKDALGGLFGKK